MGTDERPETGAAGAPAPVTGERERGDGPGRGAVTFGAVLVALGAVMLVARFLPGAPVLALWPVIVIVLGAVRAFRGPDVHGVLDGLTSVGIGCVLLANTLGYLSWSVWLNIISLWPLLIIAGGLALIGRGVGQTWLRIVAQLLIMAGLAYGALVMTAPASPFPIFVGSISTGPTVPYSVEAKTDSTATVGQAVVEYGAGSLELSSGPGLASISGDAPSDRVPTVRADALDGAVRVTAGTPEGGGVIAENTRMAVRLGNAMTWESVDLRIGAATTEADLRDLDVASVALRTGASDTRLRIGSKAPSVTVRIDAGAANVVVMVPKGSTVTVRAEGGLAGTNVTPGYTQVSGGTLFGGVWERTGSAGAPRIEIVSKGGLMNLDVRDDQGGPTS